MIAVRIVVRRRARNRRYGKERSVEKAKVSVEASSAVLGTKADDSMLLQLKVDVSHAVQDESAGFMDQPWARSDPG